MNKILVIAFFVVWSCAGMQAPRPSEIEAALLAQMRGDDDEPPMPKSSGPKYAGLTLESPKDEEARLARRVLRGTNQLVSVTQLRHKIPKEAEKTLARARRLSLAGNHESASKEMEKVISIDPEFAAAHNDLGVEYAQMGRFRDARAQFELAIALDPSSSSYYNLSLALFQMGDLSAAQTNVRKALVVSASEPVLHLLLAYLLMPDPNKRNETESHLRFAARTIPEAEKMLHRLQETAPANP